MTEAMQEKERAVPDCSTPLMWEYENQGEVEYGVDGNGTGFLICVNGRHLILTAGHATEGTDFERVRVLSDRSKDDCIPLVAGADVTVGEDSKKDSDFGDIGAFLVERGWEPSESDTAVRAVELPVDVDLKPGQWTAVRGFPAHLQTVDFNRKVVRTCAMRIDAKLKELNTFTHVHQIQFISDERTNPIVTVHNKFKGMSGSPVFRETPSGSTAEYTFAGILIRGGGKDRLGHFVGLDPIKQVVREVLSQAAENRR